MNNNDQFDQFAVPFEGPEEEWLRTRQVLNCPEPEEEEDKVAPGERRFKKPLLRLMQIDAAYDGWGTCDGVESRFLDEDADLFFFDLRWEPRSSDYPVRLQVMAGADVAEVVRLLRKVIDYIADPCLSSDGCIPDGFHQDGGGASTEDSSAAEGGGGGTR